MQLMQYKEIGKELLNAIKGQVWSIENMEGHDAGERSTEYIGSKVTGNKVYDYFRDSFGAYWYGTRAIVENQIVSTEMRIFGHEIRKERRRKWKKNM